MIMMRMKNMVEGPTKRNCCSSAEDFFDSSLDLPFSLSCCMMYSYYAVTCKQ